MFLIILIISIASTQKKKKPQRSTQPFLNTQSCYKPKKEEGLYFNELILTNSYLHTIFYH